MNQSTAHFKIDPRLATLLGETYRSTEQALKELVDNAWDADAENVWITLPDCMSANPIIVQDDGTGMTEQEVRKEYLLVARDRRTRKGERTFGKKRSVKGRKGIGKFAGLMAADLMSLETKSREVITFLSIHKKELLNTDKDLEEFNLPIRTNRCSENEHGTKIILSSLNQNFSFPRPENLKELLMLEYGRESDFKIFVNNELLNLEDMPGENFAIETTLPEVGKIIFKLKIVDKRQNLRNSGVAMRVGGKIVGKPKYLGLEFAEDIPQKLLKRVYGEIEADGLLDDVTADWGAFIENSKSFQITERWAQQELRKVIENKFKKEINLAKARLKREIDQRLSRLPEYRRKFAEIALEKIMIRFYYQNEERIKPIISVVLDALEHDEYWTVLQNIDKASHEDVGSFASALDSFGLIEIAFIARQAHNRLKFLDYLDELICNENTLEKEIHKALENNLWVLGSEFSLMSSNKTLAKTIEEYTGSKFTGDRANKRPDLLLLNNVLGHYLLIEFKRPSHSLTRDDENQAVKYRDDLSSIFRGKINILLLGEGKEQKISPYYDKEDTKMLSYKDIMSKARTELNWLLNELTTDKCVSEF